jgi:hypothetical protein
MKVRLSEIKRIIDEELELALSSKKLNEGGAYGEVWLSADDEWWVDAAEGDNTNVYDATTYGPFMSQVAAEKFLATKGLDPQPWVDDSGSRPTPKLSPNKKPVQKPSLSAPQLGNRPEKGNAEFLDPRTGKMVTRR